MFMGGAICGKVTEKLDQNSIKSYNCLSIDYDVETRSMLEAEIDNEIEAEIILRSKLAENSEKLIKPTNKNHQENIDATQYVDNKVKIENAPIHEHNNNPTEHILSLDTNISEFSNKIITNIGQEELKSSDDIICKSVCDEMHADLLALDKLLKISNLSNVDIDNFLDLIIGTNKDKKETLTTYQQIGHCIE